MKYYYRYCERISDGTVKGVARNDNFIRHPDPLVGFLAAESAIPCCSQLIFAIFNCRDIMIDSHPGDLSYPPSVDRSSRCKSQRRHRRDIVG